MAEEKLKTQQFQNELEQSKYLRTEDVQHALDNILISLQRNLYAIPERIIDSVLVCRDRQEAVEMIHEEFDSHMREVSEWKVEVDDADTESIRPETETDDL